MSVIRSWHKHLMHSIHPIKHHSPGRDRPDREEKQDDRTRHGGCWGCGGWQPAIVISIPFFLGFFFFSLHILGTDRATYLQVNRSLGQR
jgi:hypothetical protein